VREVGFEDLWRSADISGRCCSRCLCEFVVLKSKVHQDVLLSPREEFVCSLSGQSYWN